MRGGDVWFDVPPLNLHISTLSTLKREGKATPHEYMDEVPPKCEARRGKRKLEA
jgi:hypothetical protein